MSKFHEKVEGRTKQIVGHMVGDDELVLEGKEQERRAEEPGSAHQSSPRESAQSMRKQDGS